MNEIHLKLGKSVADLLRLIKPHTPRVDENTVKPAAHRFVNKGCRNRGIYSSREPAYDLAVPDSFSYLVYRMLYEGSCSPVSAETRHLEKKIGKYPGSKFRMHNLRVELYPVDGSACVSHRRALSVLGIGYRRESFRHSQDPVAVRHPDGRSLRHAGEKRILRQQV